MYRCIITALFVLCAGLAYSTESHQSKQRSKNKKITHKAFFTAVNRANMDVVEKILHKKPCYAHIRNKHNKTALHIAANRGMVPLIHTLHKHGANMNQSDTHGIRPIHVSVKRGNYVATRALIQCGANVEIPQNRIQPLHIAAQHGYTDIAMLLGLRGARFDTCNYQHATPIHIAAEQGHEDILHLGSAYHGTVSRMQVRNINARGNPSKNTILHILAKRDAAHLITHFITRHSAPVDAINSYLKSPLHEAAIHNSSKALQQLIRCGANREQKALYHITPLIAATYAGSVQAVKTLIKNGAQVRVCTSINKHSPLHIAAYHAHQAMIACLLHGGADITQKNYNLETPVSIAHALGRNDVANMMQSIVRHA